MGDTVLLVLNGELDHETEPALRRTLAALPGTLSSVVLDMQHVPFMDSAGLHFLRGMHRHTARHGISLFTRGWQAQPRFVLEAALHLDLTGADLSSAVRAALDPF
ncbi:STAS domain-containing protein [Streptomyces sp. NPDC048650]|uniref:STAS domain-containing protein n=1 Tax=unclassified Streptomyces TaxID=2593676 RepID=UPI00371B4C27